MRNIHFSYNFYLVSFQDLVGQSPEFSVEPLEVLWGPRQSELFYDCVILNFTQFCELLEGQMCVIAP